MRGIRTTVLTGLLFLAGICLCAQQAAAQLVQHNFDNGTTQGWGPRGSAVVTASTV
jgi:hypothetical protein